jgi:hypothetical protein
VLAFDLPANPAVPRTSARAAKFIRQKLPRQPPPENGSVLAQLLRARRNRTNRIVQTTTRANRRPSRLLTMRALISLCIAHHYSVPCLDS